MKTFSSTSIFKFTDTFKTDDDCLRYLYHFRWKSGFTCPRCGHQKAYNCSKPYTKVCKGCRYNISATNGTIFHKVLFGLRKAFYIYFLETAKTKSMSSLQVSRELEITQKTAWGFMSKVRRTLEEKNPMKLGDNIGKGENVVFVDEFVVGGYEVNKVGRSSKSKKRKVAIAVEAELDPKEKDMTKAFKLKRVFAQKIKNYSAKTLGVFMEKYVSKTTLVVTDGWKGYKPHIETFNITQDSGVMKTPFNPLNRMCQQFKSWVRGIHHHCSHQHISAYINGFCFRINRSLWKEERFHDAILMGIEYGKLFLKELPTKYQYS